MKCHPLYPESWGNCATPGLSLYHCTTWTPTVGKDMDEKPNERRQLFYMLNLNQHHERRPPDSREHQCLVLQTCCPSHLGSSTCGPRHSVLSLPTKMPALPTTAYQSPFSMIPALSLTPDNPVLSFKDAVLQPTIPRAISQRKITSFCRMSAFSSGQMGELAMLSLFSAFHLGCRVCFFYLHSKREYHFRHKYEKNNSQTMEVYMALCYAQSQFGPPLIRRVYLDPFRPKDYFELGVFPYLL